MVNNRKKQLVTGIILSASPPIRIIPRLPNGLYPLAQQTLITQPRLGSTDLTLAGVISQKACGDVPPFKINKYRWTWKNVALNLVRMSCVSNTNTMPVLLSLIIGIFIVWCWRNLWYGKYFGFLVVAQNIAFVGPKLGSLSYWRLVYRGDYDHVRYFTFKIFKLLLLFQK